MMRARPTVYLLTPTSEQAKEWVKANVQCESWQLSEDGVAIEAQHIQGIVDGMTAAGLAQHIDFDVVP
jgi:hypothetical protein